MAKEKLVEYNQVYVWELPLRLIHWTNFACVVALLVTGFIIASPTAVMSAKEASAQYWFGKVRFIHFVAAYAYLLVFVLRMYWGFVGNEFVRWKNFLPLSRARWKEMKKVFCLDVFMTCELPVESTGANSLAAVIYSGVFLFMFFQIVSGFALYSVMSKSWFPRLFAWVVPLFGGEAALRQWHHLASWVFIVFIMGHVYLSFYHDYIEGRGTMSSIIGGWKFIEKRDRPA